MKYTNFLLLGIFVGIFIISACNGGTNNSDENIVVEDIKLDPQYKAAIEAVKIEDGSDLIQSFPSPVEMAALIQDMDVAFAKKYLLSTSDYGSYDVNFKKALALGFYSADLGYLNVYNRMGEVIQYLVAIRKLADDLRIGQFFDFQTLKRLASNNDNLDSLLILSVQSYYRMDEHLRANQRANISALMVAGVWLESLYLSTQVIQEKANPQLRENIASQKDILIQLIALIYQYKNEPGYGKFVEDLMPLWKAFQQVEIIVVKGEMTEIKTDKSIIRTQGDSTIVKIDDQLLLTIVQATEQVRNKIVSFK